MINPSYTIEKPMTGKEAFKEIITECMPNTLDNQREVLKYGKYVIDELKAFEVIKRSFNANWDITGLLEDVINTVDYEDFLHEHADNECIKEEEYYVLKERLSV